MNNTPDSIETIIKRVSEKAVTSKKPVLGMVVSGASRDLAAAYAVKEKGWVELRLLGDRQRIKRTMNEEWFEPDYYMIQHCTDPNQQLAIMHEWCVNGEVDLFLKGDLSPRQVYYLLSNPYHHVRLEDGISRLCLVSMPGYPKLLSIIGDPGPGKPSFDSMVIHMKNGVHLARALGISVPRIALLSAMDKVGIDDLHTYNCRCITGMVNKNQIPEVEVEGPISFDTAVDPATVEHLGWKGPVAGKADVLVVDSHQTRSVLALTLAYFGNARTARVLLGGRTPLALLPPVPGDEIDQIASIALAIYTSQYLKQADPLDWQTHPDPLDYAW